MNNGGAERKRPNQPPERERDYSPSGRHPVMGCSESEEGWSMRQRRTVSPTLNLGHAAATICKEVR